MIRFYTSIRSGIYYYKWRGGYSLQVDERGYVHYWKPGIQPDSTDPIASEEIADWFKVIDLLL